MSLLECKIAFSNYDWVRPEEFDEEWLPQFKLDVYQKVMKDFFEIELVCAQLDKQ